MENKNSAKLTEKRRSSELISNYEPPFIEIIEVSLEKGFADSSTDFGEGAW
ncbi:MAG: hypothetical protein H6Q22_1456 [Bacteroidetes bacterium]|nr:hypothetical protein [Bacteroidota bacterium]